MSGDQPGIDANLKGEASNAKRSATALFAFLARSLQQIATLVITLLAARFLMPAEYGVYSLGIVFITLVQTLTYTGFYHFIVTAKEDDSEVLSTSFWMILALTTGAAALLAALAYPIAWLFDAPDLAPVLLLLAAIQPIAGIGAWFSAVLLRREALNLHFSIMFLQNLLALIGGIILLWLWKSLFALVAYRYLRILTGLILYLTMSRDRPSLKANFALAKQAVSFSAGLYGSRFLSFLSRYAGDLLLGLMFTTAEAGLYRFGNRLATASIDVIGQPMRSFALTQFGAAGRKDIDLAEPLERFVGSIVLLTGGVAAVVIAFGEQVVTDYFNPAYLAGIVVTYAMAVRGVVGVGRTLLEPAFAAKGNTKIVMMFNLVWAAITVSVLFLTAPFGLAALAWGQAFTAGISTLSALWLLRQRGGLRIGGAIRALAVAGVLVICYGAIVITTVPWIVGFTELQHFGQLVLGLLWALLLSLPTVAVAWRLKVFTLRVFSG